VAGNPSIAVVPGRTYVFSVQTPDAKFALHRVSGDVTSASRYSDGSVSGQGTAQVSLTVVRRFCFCFCFFKDVLQSDNTPVVLYYQSEVAGNEHLFGQINVQVTTTVATTTVPPAELYVARFYNDSASCATIPFSVITTQAGVCFPNPFLPPGAGFIKYATINSTAVSGGGYSDSSCTSTVAPLADQLLSVCNPVVQIPTFSVRIDRAETTTATTAAATTTVAPDATTTPAPIVTTSPTSTVLPTTTVPRAPTSPATFSVSGMNLGITSPEWIVNGVAGSPVITLVRGRSYTFDVATPAQLFAIHMVSGSTATANRYNEGVTNQATSQVQFVVPATAPDTLFYQSEAVADMFGTISVVSEASQATSTTAATTIVTTAPTVPVVTTVPSVRGENFTVSAMNIGATPPEWIVNGVAGSPPITLVRGRTYRFFVTTPSFLFSIHQTAGSTSLANRYDLGIEGQAQSELVWSVSNSAPARLFYQSELLSDLFGEVNIVSETTTSTVETTGAQPGTTVPGTTVSGVPVTTGAGTSAPGTTGASAGTTAPGTTGASVRTTVPGTSAASFPPSTTTPAPPCRMAVCCVLGSRPIPIGFSEFVLTVNQTFATFDCPAFATLLRRDMQLASPAQLIVLSVEPGSVVFGAAAPTATVDAYMLFISQGRQNPDLRIGE
jgi:hypothetical protein